jgi:MerR family transcriptional regulator, light-induced transcriptional regulator
MNDNLSVWKLDIPKEGLAQMALERQFNQYPDLARNYSPYQRQKSLEDMVYHMRFLEAACESGSPQIFTNYLMWLKDLLQRLGVPTEVLKQSILFVDQTIRSEAPHLLTNEYTNVLNAGLSSLESNKTMFQSYLTPDQPHADLAEKYLAFLLDGNRHEACDLILSRVGAGMSVKDVYLHVFQTVQYQVGYLWHQGKITVAQEHFCTAATQYIIARLYPSIFQNSINGPKIVAASIGNELHEMGIRMVADFLELSGYDTYYLGANTPPEGILHTVKHNQPLALALSVTIAFHVGELISLIEALRSDPLCRNTKVLVGGYAFNTNDQLWRSVGADGYARDAQGAIELLSNM